MSPSTRVKHMVTPVALAAWPILWFIQSNAQDITDADRLLWWIVAPLVAAATLALGADFARRGMGWSVWWAAAMALFCWWTYADAARVGELVGLRVRWQFLLWITAAGAAVTWTARASRGRYPGALGVMTFCLYGLLGFDKVVDLARAANRDARAETAWSAPDGRPDIVLLILDGLARPDVLDSMSAGAGTAWRDTLRSRGFAIADEAQTIEATTERSLGTVLQQRPFRADEASTASSRGLRMLRGDNPTVAWLRSSGYRIAHVEPGYVQHSRCSKLVDSCWAPGGWRLKDEDVALLRRSPIEPLGFMGRVPLTQVSLSHPDDVDRAHASLATGKPFFLFAHLLMPHEAVFGPNCVLRASFPPMNWEPMRQQEYLTASRCLTGHVADFADRVAARGRPTALIVMSDHGPAFAGQFAGKDTASRHWTDRQRRERLSVLVAWRLPVPCPLPRTISLPSLFPTMRECFSPQRFPHPS